MSEGIRFGERLFLPVMMAPRMRARGDPWHRPLWVYVLDPARTGLKAPMAQIDVPYEPLECGIKGGLFELEHEPLPDCLLRHLDWPQRLIDKYRDEPLDLEDPKVAMSGGIMPCTGEPRFAGQMLYAVCQRVYACFAEALGRHPTWGPWAARNVREGKKPALRLRPFAFDRANAHYDHMAGTLEFGVFNAQPSRSPYILPGGLVILALSHDVIVHEVTHAILDGMRALFLQNTHPDVPAFHEAFADLVALFHHFRYRELVMQAIQQHGSIDSDMLLALAREFGEALYGREGSALRVAVESQPGRKNEARQPQQYSDSEPLEPHLRGGILISAVFSAFLQVYDRQVAPLLRLANVATSGNPERPLPHELTSMLADEASRLADEFLHVCIRAIDYCPPMDVRFGEYLRAIITADRMLNHDDRFGIRDALIKEFRRRSIDLGRVRDLSDYSLEWNFPSRKEGLYIRGLAWSQLRFRNDGVTPLGVAEIERQAKALGDFLLYEIGRDELAEFGLQAPGLTFGPVTVESLRCVTRRSRDGRVTHGMVAEVSQQCATSHGATIGGSTIILEEDGRVQFAIKKRVGNKAREHSRADYLKRTGRSERISFKALHSSSL